jgi:hypothetical protein
MISVVRTATPPCIHGTRADASTPWDGGEGGVSCYPFCAISANVALGEASLSLWARNRHEPSIDAFMENSALV